ncbi:MAG TPA: PaaX family transcriptional regulator C-terminal domain-containing protein [Acidimicrobiales bacterium]
MSQRRNTRSLTARSVLLSVLLGTDPPRLPVQVLVRTTELFGIAEGTTRTALSRMAAAGEVEADDGHYALAADRLLARQARQTASREARTRPGWDGAWSEVVVGAPGRRRAAADRAALRAALGAARLAELREGVWLRPDNLGLRPGDLALPADTDVRWFRTFPLDDGPALAAQLWDLDGWAQAAEELRDRMAVLVEPLEAGDRGSLRDGFVLSADVLRHFQLDPLLPAELLPAGWPGDALRKDYDRYDAAYRLVLRDWLRGHG